ncbi:FixH family protein [Paenibacillus lemnae]|uniref:YtkA-like domain-containing protein n=1 Tax=Paenibacillus lemnae TaxID=1330551 RepID=A0A848M4H1_PAELE|nr:FixH family protein [Paenibacillus lemnae]NMO95968.1 hypothetical protein [Paenibacillus lemnae]
MKRSASNKKIKVNCALISALILTAIALGGCSNGNAGDSDTLVMEDPIIVDLSLSKESAGKDEKVKFTANVSQSGVPVEDADKVEFEIRQEGGGLQITVPARHSEEGSYILEKSFQKPGTYLIISHVTARGQHSMPMKELKIVP